MSNFRNERNALMASLQASSTTWIAGIQAAGEAQKPLVAELDAIRAQRDRAERAGVRVRATADDLDARELRAMIAAGAHTSSIGMKAGEYCGAMAQYLARAVAIIDRMADELEAPEQARAEAAETAKREAAEAAARAVEKAKDDERIDWQRDLQREHAIKERREEQAATNGVTLDHASLNAGLPKLANLEELRLIAAAAK